MHSHLHSFGRAYYSLRSYMPYRWKVHWSVVYENESRLKSCKILPFRFIHFISLTGREEYCSDYGAPSFKNVSSFWDDVRG